MEDSILISLFSVELILKKIEDDISFKEIDKMRKPFAVTSTLSMCMKNSIASVLKPDPRADDELLETEDAGEEPVPARTDNFTANSKINKVVKEVNPIIQNFL